MKCEIERSCSPLYSSKSTIKLCIWLERLWLKASLILLESLVCVGKSSLELSKLLLLRLHLLSIHLLWLLLIYLTPLIKLSSLPLRLLLLRLEKLWLKAVSLRLLLYLSLLSERSPISELTLLAKILLLWLLRGIKLRLEGFFRLSPLLALCRLSLTHLRHEVHLLILLLRCWELIGVLHWLKGGGCRWRILTVLVEIRQCFKGSIFGGLGFRIRILIIHRHQIRKLLRLIGLLCRLLLWGNSIGIGCWGLTLEFGEAVGRLSGDKFRKLVVIRCCFLGDGVAKTYQIFYRQSLLLFLLDHWFGLWLLKLSLFSRAGRFASRCFLFVG